jgi:hypothetical protein
LYNNVNHNNNVILIIRNITAYSNINARQVIREFLKPSIRRFDQSIQARGSSNASSAIRKFLNPSRDADMRLLCVSTLRREFTPECEQIPEMANSTTDNHVDALIC